MVRDLTWKNFDLRLRVKVTALWSFLVRKPCICNIYPWKIYGCMGYVDDPLLFGCILALCGSCIQLNYVVVSGHFFSFLVYWLTWKEKKSLRGLWRILRARRLKVDIWLERKIMALCPYVCRKPCMFAHKTLRVRCVYWRPFERYCSLDACLPTMQCTWWFSDDSFFLLSVSAPLEKMFCNEMLGGYTE